MKEAESVRAEVLRIFPELSAEEVSDLVSASALCRFRKGESLATEGRVHTRTDWLLSGTVALLKGSLPGRDIVLHVLAEEHFIELSTLFHKGPFPMNVRALEDCLVLRMDSRALLALSARNGSFALRLMRALAVRQRMYINKISVSHGKISTRRRVAGWLVHKARMEGSLEVKDCITREMLAGLLGLSRESLSRQLSAFAKEGAIALARGAIVILDEAALQSAKND